MQTNVELRAAPRTLFGKKTGALRRQGWVPGNVFGAGGEPLPIQLHTREIEHLLTHVPRAAALTLVVDGEGRQTVRVHAVARKPTTDALLHVDFVRVVAATPSGAAPAGRRDAEGEPEADAPAD